MPTYEYLCNDCHGVFEKTQTMAAHDHDAINCPKCGSKNVQQEPARFYCVTSKKSA